MRSTACSTAPSDRASTRSCCAKQATTRSRRSSPSAADQTVREAVSLLHEHRVSPAPGGLRPRPQHAVVGSIGERGVLKHAVHRTRRLGAPIVDVMEPPFPPSSRSSARARRRRAALRRPPGAARHPRRPGGWHPHARRSPGVPRGVTEPDRDALATQVVHAGPTRRTARSSLPSTRPRPLAQTAGRGVHRGLRLRAQRRTRARRARAARWETLEGGHGTSFSSGMAATHALLTAICFGGATT